MRCTVSRALNKLSVVTSPLHEMFLPSQLERTLALLLSSPLPEMFRLWQIERTLGLLLSPLFLKCSVFRTLNGL